MKEKKDDRLFAKFTLDFPDSPKIEPLSDKAFRALIEMTIYSRRMLTDGFIPDAMVKARPRWKSAAKELIANDSERPSLLIVDGGYQIWDFAQHQDTRSEVEARRLRNAANGRRGGLAKSKQVASESLSKPVSESLSENVAEDRRQKTDISPQNTSYSSPQGAKRGTRLEPDWKPTTETVNAIEQDCPGFDYAQEHKKFVDYWIARPGQGGTKLDWDATWRNWMRRASEESQKNKKTTRTEDNLAFVAKLGALQKWKEIA